jgi:glycosyltransferase involved in cell wall biosynthesis
VKILIFNWQDIKNPLGGGADVHMHEIFKRVAARGHQVTLCCSALPGAPAEETIDGIRVIRRGGRYLFNFRAAFEYWRRFRHESYDVVIDDMNKIPFFTPLFVRRPLAIIIHHLFQKSIFNEALFPLALYVYELEKLAVRLIRAADVPVFVVSPSTKQEVMEKGIRERNIRLVPNCVDHARYRKTGVPRSAEALIGYFGRLKKYKSVDHLLDAFVLVRKTVPGVSLVIIGDGDYRPVLEERAKRLGIGDAVHFTGYVDESVKVDWLNKVWFLVNTSAKEGWGLTVIEANACGTPVIASNVPGLRDAVNDGSTGLLYPYGDIADLAAKMLRLLADHDERSGFGSAAVQWAQTFDWEAVADRTCGYLQAAIDGYGRRNTNV